MNRKILNALAVSGLVMALGACASVGPAQYQPADEKGFGYAEQRIESDRYRIRYQGSGGEAPEQVEDYALRRAAELTLADGGEWFEVVNRDIVRESRGGVGIGAGVGSGSYGRRGGVNVGVGGDFGRVGARDYFTVTLEILIGAGEAAGDPRDVYDAADVIARVTD